MKLVNNKGFKDGICWRCTKYKPIQHDNKINIRSESILSDMRADIRILYLIIFENFTFRNSVNVTYKNCLEFSKDLKIETISKNYIGKIFNIIRLKIMETTYNFCKNNLMGM